MKKAPIDLGPRLDDGEQAAEILDSRLLYQGKTRLASYRLRSRQFDGTWSEPYQRYAYASVESGHASAALPYDPVRDVVVLVEQFRFVAFLNHRPTAWCLEIPAGMIAIGDDAESTIRRELVEESGHAARRLEPIGLMATSPGVFVETVQVYLAEIEAAGAGSIHGLAEEHENIRVHILSYEDVMKLADDGWIDDGKTLYALNWFARKREAIRHRWLQEK